MSIIIQLYNEYLVLYKKIIGTQKATKAKPSRLSSFQITPCICDNKYKPDQGIL